MTDTTVEAPTQSVRTYRHAVRGLLHEATGSTPELRQAREEVKYALNGAIQAALSGVQGMTQEEQVQRLTETRDAIQERVVGLDEKVAAVVAATQEWAAHVTETVERAIEQASEAIDYAATRDFEAHQAAKEERRAQRYSAEQAAWQAEFGDEDLEDDDSNDDD